MADTSKSFFEKIGEERGLIGITTELVVASRENGKISVLLVRRSDKPHEPLPNQWELPRGFLGKDETLEETAHRELREKTRAFMPPLRFEQIGTFSDPDREPQGRIISTAFLIVVDRTDVQPRAGSDAKEVRWFPTDKLPKPLAYDHDAIMARALERLNKLRRPRIHVPPRSLDDRPVQKPRTPRKGRKRKPTNA